MTAVRSTTIPPVTYYVSQSTGSDANTGTSEAAAWQTLAKITGLASGFLRPGDTVLLKRGDIWREQLTWPAGNLGTASQRITLGAYGAGERPWIKGQDGVSNSGWTLQTGSTYWKTHADPTDIWLVNGILLTKQTSIATVDAAPGSFWYDSGTGRVYMRLLDSTNPGVSNPSVESGTRTWGIAINGNSTAFGVTDFITVQDIQMTGALNDGIHVKHSDGIIVQRCLAYYNQQWGIVFGNEGSLLNRNGKILNNTAWGNRQFGGVGGGATTNWEISGNISYNNGRANWVDHNVYCSYGSDCKVTNNVAWGAAAHNFKFGGSVTGGYMKNNISLNAAQAGFFADQGATGVNFYQNTDYGSLWGLNLYDTGTAVAVVDVINNIFAFNTQYGVYVGTGDTITSFLYNDVYGATTSNYHGYTDPTGSNGNISSDPLFVNPNARILSLLPSSPCIGTGYVSNSRDHQTLRGTSNDIGGALRDPTITSDLAAAYEATVAAAPTTGAHRKGERVWNNAPTSGGTMGWVCTTSGTPGTWKTFGAIS